MQHNLSCATLITIGFDMRQMKLWMTEEFLGWRKPLELSMLSLRLEPDEAWEPECMNVFLGKGKYDGRPDYNFAQE